jgi:hypothetical protein
MASRTEKNTFEDLLRRHNQACFWLSSTVINDRFFQIKDFILSHAPNPAFLDATFSTDSPEVASLLFDLHGEEPYRSGFEDKKKISYPHFMLISDGRSLSFLRLLQDRTMPLKKFAYSFAQTAFNADDADFYNFAEEINESPIPVLRELDSHKRLLPACRMNMAPRVLEELPYFDVDYVSRSYSAQDPIPLKPLAIWILAGRDFSEWVSNIDPRLHKIARASGSNHGRLQLCAKETDILDVIGRDPSKDFFDCTP